MAIKIKSQPQMCSIRDALSIMVGAPTPGLGNGYELHIAQNQEDDVVLSLVNGRTLERAVSVTPSGEMDW